MIRAPLREIGQNDRPVIPPATAMEWELSGSWPTAKARSEFWDQPTVPPHLRHEPDPRRIFMGDEGLLQYDTELAERHEARLAWLREQVEIG